MLPLEEGEDGEDVVAGVRAAFFLLRLGVSGFSFFGVPLLPAGPLEAGERRCFFRSCSAGSASASSRRISAALAA